MVLASCGSDVADSPNVSSGPAEPTTGAEDASDLACEVEGYPCTLADVPTEILDTQSRYIDELRAHLADGSLDEAASWLRAQEGVVEAEANETALRFRIAGGRPMYVLRPPLDEAPITGTAPWSGVGSGQAIARLTAGFPQRGTVPEPSHDAEVVGEGVVGEHPQNRKRALFLEPFATHGIDGFATAVTQLMQVGDYTHDADDIQHLQNIDVSPDEFMGWERYDAIFVKSHGGTIGNDSFVATGVKEPLRGASWADVCAGLKSWWDGIPGVDCGLVEESRLDARTGEPVRDANGKLIPETWVVVGLVPDFFRDQYGQHGGLLKKIIYIGGCDSLTKTDMAHALAGSSSAFIGWNGQPYRRTERESSHALLSLLIEERETVGIGHARLCAAFFCRDPDIDGAQLEIYDNGAGPRGLRLYDVPTLHDPVAPNAILDPGSRLKVEGVGGDGQPDQLRLTIELNGIIDPEDTSPIPEPPSSPPEDPGNVWNGVILASSHASPAHLYDLHLYVDDERIGSDNLGSPQQSAEVEQLDATTYRYTNTFTLPFDVDPAGTRATLKVAVDLPEGGISDYEVEVVLDPIPEPCDLADVDALNAALGTSFPHDQPPPPEVTLGQGWCKWVEPLYEDWTKSELSLVLATPSTGVFMDGMWEANPDLRVELPADPAGNGGIDAAIYEPGSTGNPTSIVLDDGSVAIGAHANLHFKASGLWITLSASGATAIEANLEGRLVEVAKIVAASLSGGRD